jgi:hypothetical protein
MVLLVSDGLQHVHWLILEVLFDWLTFCFFRINLPLGGITFVVTAIFLKETGAQNGGEVRGWKGTIQALDLLGTLFFVPALTCLFVSQPST